MQKKLLCCLLLMQCFAQSDLFCAVAAPEKFDSVETSRKEVVVTQYDKLDYYVAMRSLQQQDIQRSNNESELCWSYSLPFYKRGKRDSIRFMPWIIIKTIQSFMEDEKSKNCLQDFLQACECSKRQDFFVNDTFLPVSILFNNLKEANWRESVMPSRLFNFPSIGLSFQHELRDGRLGGREEVVWVECHERKSFPKSVHIELKDEDYDEFEGTVLGISACYVRKKLEQAISDSRKEVKFDISLGSYIAKKRASLVYRDGRTEIELTRK